MRKFTKRVIWFFGIWLITILEDYVYFLINGYGIVSSIELGFTMALIMVLPLFFMKDDVSKSTSKPEDSEENE